MIRSFLTHEVKVGNLGIGGENPVRIQSMTNTNTMDTQATAEQCISLFEAGCELVRITAPGIKEAENLAAIKAAIKSRGYEIPLIADIHYSPKAAEVAAALVEKVRINPGNYTDRNRGKINFTDAGYHEALEKIKENISPLISLCKKHGTALRIGSNHGSLSDRIMDRFGDTPEGMVESALEFARICRDEDFHQIVFSMKASNVRVMVYATRLLVKKMMDEGMTYPVHLGVTEAGDATQGRVKSALGIGALLSEGIGNTIRVSLTEDPVNEIPVAKKIVQYIYPHDSGFSENIFEQYFYPPFEFQQRTSLAGDFGVEQKPPLVIASTKPAKSSLQPDLVLDTQKIDKMGFSSFDLDAAELIKLHSSKPLVLSGAEGLAVLGFRNFMKKMEEKHFANAVIFRKHYESFGEELGIEAAIDFGPLFLDGFGDGIWIESEKSGSDELVSLSFDILQASGARISKTEFIACPSCGRTQYNIRAALQKIKAATSHLTGLKIAVMGCIVNGPGEMADADYGYVGMGAGKVALYKGKHQVAKGIDEVDAVEALVNLIKEGGDWKNL
ncbi:MAG: (E)-4-hydroxy-3-methylbut-2-enyl-diphosphate synthase [Bacteroidales bacterium]|nr:(E)-4-hydroxy-3-methylbut-2-enyl-diphosphate synthase [Bacteroidales bacterium]